MNAKIQIIVGAIIGAILGAISGYVYVCRIIMTTLKPKINNIYSLSLSRLKITSILK